ncbi:MAG: PQQ-like beta-propeller repeat protein, partial [Chitinophagaceae bacterium]|nr:PQQ-like beta-propeller repeat protein [Chitinophagaceae bacterium]
TKEIVSFSFKKTDNPSLPEDVHGTIRNDSILVTLPFGTTVKALKPTVLINGQDVSPANLSSQDFTEPIAYTVRAEDRSSRIYTAVVILSESQLYGTMFINSSYANLSGVGRLYAIDINTGKLRWKYAMDSSGSYPPPFFKEGIVYTAVQRKLLAIDTVTKAVKWQFIAGDFIQSAPVIVNNILYFNCNDRALYALDVSTGQLLWKFLQTSPGQDDPANTSSPTIVNGVLYFASSDQHIYAVNALTGALKWKTYNSLGMGATIHSSVSVVGDKLYVGDFYRNLLAFNISDGSQAWVFNPFGPMHSSPTVLDGVVYIGAAQHFYAVNAADGTLKWRIPTAFHIFSSPIVSGNTVYITSDGPNSGILYALNIADGTQKWIFQNDHGFQGSPVVVEDVVFCPSYSSVVAVNAATGKLRWRFRTDTNLEDITASPVIVDVKGKVYHSSVSGAQQ